MSENKIISDKDSLIDFLENKIMSISQLKQEIEDNSQFDLEVENLQNILNSKVIPLLKCDDVKCVRKGDVKVDLKHVSSDPMVEVKNVK